MGSIDPEDRDLERRGVTISRREFFDSGGRAFDMQAVQADCGVARTDAEIDYSENEYTGSHGSGDLVRLMDEQLEDAKAKLKAEQRRQSVTKRAYKLLNESLDLRELQSKNPAEAYRQAEVRATQDVIRGIDLIPFESLETSNAGTYQWIERRTKELQAAGACLFDAVAQAREEASTGVSGSEEKPKAPDTDYLYGDEPGPKTIESLMEASVDPGGHSRSAKGAPKKRVTPDKQRRYDDILGDDGRQKSEVERAREMQERNARALESRKHGPGAPLKGNEPRMRVNIRLEPSTVVDLHDMTGKNCAELVEEMHRVLRMAKSGAESVAIANALAHLLDAGEPDRLAS